MATLITTQGLIPDYTCATQAWQNPQTPINNRLLQNKSKLDEFHLNQYDITFPMGI